MSRKPARSNTETRGISNLHQTYIALTDRPSSPFSSAQKRGRLERGPKTGSVQSHLSTPHPTPAEVLDDAVVGMGGVEHG